VGDRGQYYTRYQVGSQRKLHCRRPRQGGPEQILLDENALAQGRRAFSVAETAVSPDHNLLAYSVDADGAERNTLKVRDLTTGQDLDDTIPEVRGGAVWSKDGQWLFYVGRDPSKWGQKVFRHRLGTPITDDELVHEEMAEGFSVSLRLTLSDRFLVIEGGDFSTADVKLIDLGQSDRAAADDHRAQAGTEVCGDGPRRSPDIPHERRRRHRLEDRRQARLARPMPRCGRSCLTF
jgi:oligopeptidase B